MGLEDILEGNPIVRSIGSKRIKGVLDTAQEDKDTTAKYAFIAMELVKRAKGEDALDKMVSAIIANHMPAGTKKDEFISYVSNEHNWIDGLLYVLFMEYGKEVLQIDDFYRHVGRTTVNPMFTLVAAGELMGINFIYQKAAELNPNFTRAIDLEYKKKGSRNGHAIIIRRTKDYYRQKLLRVFGEELYRTVLMNDDILTQGVLEGVPRAVSIGNDFARIADEPSCEIRSGQDYCEYHIEWTPKPYIDFSEVSWENPLSIASVARKMVGGLGKAITIGIIYKIPTVRKLVDRIVGMEIAMQQYAEEVKRVEEEKHIYERLAAQAEALSRLVHQLGPVAQRMWDFTIPLEELIGQGAGIEPLMQKAGSYNLPEDARKSLRDVLTAITSVTQYYQPLFLNPLETLGSLTDNFTKLFSQEKEYRDLNEDMGYVLELVNRGNLLGSVSTEFEEGRIPSQAYLPHAYPGIFLEIFSNAVSHGRAKKLKVRTEYSAEESKLRVFMYNDGNPIPQESWNVVLGGNNSSKSGFGLPDISRVVQRDNGKIFLQQPDDPLYNVCFVIEYSNIKLMPLAK